MNAVRQKCRPKHQVLVLKCYPRFQKNVQEVKPNSSELSYLLYYASTRRSKLQKVGSFLEKRTASDVWKQRLGNVQVTLQILSALMEKAPRDLPLYSDSVLTILETVLKSKDINMIEESLATFETYCKYQDASSLASDQYRSQQYQNIVSMYAEFASNNFPSSLKQKPNKPTAMRWKTAGLRAIRSVVGAEALGTDGTTQLSIVMPAILDNLYTGNDDILASLQEKAQTGEKADVENARKRRMSFATVTTVDTVEGNPASASETTADADKAAEDEVRVLAVRCLKQIFAAGTGSNRGQVRLAMNLTLKFITARDSPAPALPGSTPASGGRGNWATSLVETIARWTPVQDRFIIVITAVDALVKSPIEESKLKQQLTLATAIDWLLSSSINLIGLSVMDVLLGFLQHVLLLLQPGGRDSRITPHSQQTGALNSHPTINPEKVEERGHTTNVITPPPVRQELLVRLQRCIGDLATHIYYTDQIADMMAAILARLKPPLHPDLSSIAAAIENPVGAANAIANSVDLQEDALTDGFFSFATARLNALRAVKNILLVANMRKSVTGAAAEARSRVGVQVWEGTQWLLRDEDREVRVAYVDALLTWLQHETNRSDLLLPQEGPRKPKSVAKKGRDENGEPKLARRAVSSASRKENKTAKSNFLRLLHLAIYDNAIKSVQSDSDILLLHLLLTNLTEKLGVNAVRHGLPMMARLQDDLVSGDKFEDARCRINAGSLVHGYFWALSEKFDFETSRVGQELHAEISRRKKNGFWLDKVRLPALPLDQIITSTAALTDKGTLVSDMSSKSLKPYSSRVNMVEEICTFYNESLRAPTTSPPSSPGRVFSVPALSFGYGFGLNPGPKPSPEDQLPPKVKEELLAEWSKESVIAAVEKEHADSLSGSKTGTGTGSATAGRNFLTVDAVNGLGRGAASPGGNDSPTRVVSDSGGPRMSALSYALNGGLGHLQRLRGPGTDDGSPTPLTASSSRDSTVRVTELKRALSGYQNNVRHSSPLGRRVTGIRDSSVDSVQSHGSSSGSESMVNYSEAEGAGDHASALDVNAVGHTDFATAAPPPPSRNEQRQSSGADTARPGSSQAPSSIPPEQHHPRPVNDIHAATTLPRAKSDPRLGEDVPPVPEIPSSLTLHLPGTFPRDISPIRQPSLRSSKSVERQSSQPRAIQPQRHGQKVLLRPSTAPSPASQTRIKEASASSQSPATSTRLASTSLSAREGRTWRRREKSRPASSRHSGMGSAPIGGKLPGSESGSVKTKRVQDLGRLLAGVRVDDDDDDDDDDNDGEDGQGGRGAVSSSDNRFRAKGRAGEGGNANGQQGGGGGGGGGIHIQPPY
ncbi:hypothetical protein GJ744_008624 [Endocarpon pusillum]|uniref:Protein EFR3 n=1 Tax=Endocarpon pusillum TaxID=364733 RepID=A0A8H7E551_9EURO|nr:hypothetical protein GJ744_008624 [Endocarpon pusillum]